MSVTCNLYHGTIPWYRGVCAESGRASDSPCPTVIVLNIKTEKRAPVATEAVFMMNTHTGDIEHTQATYGSPFGQDSLNPMVASRVFFTTCQQPVATVGRATCAPGHECCIARSGAANRYAAACFGFKWAAPSARAAAGHNYRGHAQDAATNDARRALSGIQGFKSAMPEGASEAPRWFE